MSSQIVAKASGKNLPISFKDSVNVCSAIRGMPAEKALKYLEDVIKMKRPIPYKRYRRDMAHRKGRVGPGRFPRKECEYIKDVLENAIANAKSKGMESSKLYISKIIANKAVSKEKMKRGFPKGTNIYVELIEREVEGKKKEEAKSEIKEEKKEEEKNVEKGEREGK